MNVYVLVFLSSFFLNVVALKHPYTVFQGYGYVARNKTTETYQQAEFECEDLGGQLAKLRSEEVNTFFKNTLLLPYGKSRLSVYTCEYLL